MGHSKSVKPLVSPHASHPSFHTCLPTAYLPVHSPHRSDNSFLTFTNRILILLYCEPTAINLPINLAYPHTSHRPTLLHTYRKTIDTCSISLLASSLLSSPPPPSPPTFPPSPISLRVHFYDHLIRDSYYSFITFVFLFFSSVS